MLKSLHRRGSSSLRSRAAALACLVAGLLFVSACGEVRYRMGQQVDTGALERSLQVGQSTERDVREALGEPDGVGRYLPPIDFEPRRMWAYYYEEGTPKEARRTMLFVLFRNDRYDGYLWFSSLLEGEAQVSRR